jgi:hypothetical protein
MRSEPTELTPLFPSGTTKVIIHGNWGKELVWGVVELWLRFFLSCSILFTLEYPLEGVH